MGTIGSDTHTRLDPVRRLALPRRSTMLRLALAAVLLLTAAGTLYGGADTPPPPPAAPPPASVPASSPVEDDDASRLPVPSDLVGVPVSLGESTALAVVRPGDRVDLLSVPAEGGEPVPLADGVLVLAVDGLGGALFVALTPAQARELISTPVATRFAVIVRP